MLKKAIIGKKVGMTQIFDETGKVIPVTVIEAGPCTVVQKKTADKEGYDAVQVGFGATEERKLSKPELGHLKKANAEPVRILKEFKLENAADMQIGDVIKADVFAEGDHVDVVGVSKGKGYAGTTKRYGNKIGPISHGSKYHRGVGSMGPTTDPGRVMPGKHMPGHMGSDTVTVQNLTVVKVDGERGLLLIKGAVPGPKGALLEIAESVKA